jgi:hypothetical protein
LNRKPRRYLVGAGDLQKLSQVIDWSVFEEEWAKLYSRVVVVQRHRGGWYTLFQTAVTEQLLLSPLLLSHLSNPSRKNKRIKIILQALKQQRF